MHFLYRREEGRVADCEIEAVEAKGRERDERARRQSLQEAHARAEVVGLDVGGGMGEGGGVDVGAAHDPGGAGAEEKKGVDSGGTGTTRRGSVGANIANVREGKELESGVSHV